MPRREPPLRAFDELRELADFAPLRVEVFAADFFAADFVAAVRGSRAGASGAVVDAVPGAGAAGLGVAPPVPGICGGLGIVGAVGLDMIVSCATG